MPPDATYRPAPRFTALGDNFYDVVEAARFPVHVLRFRNQRWAERVGLGTLTPDEWEAAFARFEPLPGNLPAPLALRYHGHQFQTYNPQLGDGRGFLFAQLEDERGRLLDLATKGSGQTPWSRGGDGKLTLKGGVREILATEMLEALGVPTSKTFSLFETGERLMRGDEPSPTRSSVLVRLGHSHVRFGSFQRHAHRGDVESLRALVDFTVAHYAPELCHTGGAAAAEMLLARVVERTARMCAAWMAAGFVHGVLNTDNLNVTGESFDYGPWRFLPVFDPTFTAAYFDHSGLYAYGNQPTAVRWNLEQLALALAPVAGRVLPVRERFDGLFEDALDGAIVARLGVRRRGPLWDRLLRGAVFRFLSDSKMGFERLFFDAWGGRVNPRVPAGLRDELAGYEAVDAARLQHPYFAGDAPCTMLIEEVEAIWAAIAVRDDWSGLDAKIEAIQVMGDALGLAQAG